jgi:hypothetical protein
LLHLQRAWSNDRIFCHTMYKMPVCLESNNLMLIIKYWVILILLLSIYSTPCFGQAADEGEISDSPAVRNKHRIDTTLTYVNSHEFDEFAGALGYTYSYSKNVNFSFGISYLDSDLDRRGGSGIGDASFVFAWSPNVNLDASPWFPKNAGSGIHLLIPTGNADDGRSLDSTIITPFLGFVYPIADSFFILPSVGYAYSFDPTVTRGDIRILFAELGFSWNSAYGFWVGFYPTWIRDYESDDDHINYTVTVGKVFDNRWGLSVDLANMEHFVPGKTPIIDETLDTMIEVNLHFLF